MIAGAQNVAISKSEAHHVEQTKAVPSHDTQTVPEHIVALHCGRTGQVGSPSPSTSVGLGWDVADALCTLQCEFSRDSCGIRRGRPDQACIAVALLRNRIHDVDAKELKL